MRRAYVLLSGGIDSTTCLYVAKQQYEQAIGVSVDYGQRHRKEIEYAKRSCARLECQHVELNLRGIVPKTMLTDPDSVVPDISYHDIQGVSPTYVPFRNGLLLSAVTSYVTGERDRIEKVMPGLPEWAIYFGAHAEDAQNWAYPDCTPEFIGSMANAIFIGTYNGVRLHTPLEWMNKQQIISWGQSLEVDWRNTWSCYKGEDMHCGVCPTCRARREGFAKAYVNDPTVYASEPKAAFARA
jgi:7-cyano-7-deazaguanine synthase